MYIVIVNGASGSGKTTIVNLIKEYLSFSDFKIEVVSMDQFYKSLKPGTHPHNWDHIDAIDVDRMVRCIGDLQKGENTYFPTYDYVTHQSIPDAYTIEKIDVLIIEGIFALYDERLRDMADLKIYVDADPYKTCFLRRFNRDIQERGRSPQSIIDQYFGQVLDGYKQFVEPTKIYADIYYTNELIKPDKNTSFIEMVSDFIYHNALANKSNPLKII